MVNIIIAAAAVFVIALLVVALVRANINKKKLDAKIIEFEAQSEQLRKINEKLEQSVLNEQNLKNSLESTVIIRTAEMVEKNKELSRSNEEIIALLGDVVEMRDQDSGNHVMRVKAFTKILVDKLREKCPEYGLTDEDAVIIASASVLHDVGKIYIPDAILLKPGRLTDEEFDIMKTHSVKGCDVLMRAPKGWSKKYLEVSRDICRYHHEKWDGQGYPDGLKGDEIPIAAQIVSLCDCFDALTTKRPYKDAYSVDKAYEMIIGGECGQFSSKILKCFTECREEFTRCADNPSCILGETPVSELSGGPLLGLKLLLVDDDDMTRELNRDILESEGATVIEASDGAEAIEIFKNGKFDAVLMDLVMPGIGGIEATLRMRALEKGFSGSVPIIILTADGSDSQIDACIEAGGDACMAKPLVVTDLIRILLASMRARSSGTGQNSSGDGNKADTDQLTGVKNITAYTDIIAQLSEEMHTNAMMTFAIVMCDVDDLKDVNDTYGHPMGDLYIRNCSNIITEEFSHSPVFRIGGDEFIVILRDIDYSNRERRIESLKKQFEIASSIESFDDGRASISIGMAVYDRDTDDSVRDVVRRAGELVSKDKARKKSGGGNHRSLIDAIR